MWAVRARTVLIALTVLVAVYAGGITGVSALQRHAFDDHCRAEHGFIYPDLDTVDRACSHDPPVPGQIDRIDFGWLERPNPLWIYSVNWP